MQNNCVASAPVVDEHVVGVELVKQADCTDGAFVAAMQALRPRLRDSWRG